MANYMADKRQIWNWTFQFIKDSGGYGCCVMKFIKATKAQIIDTTPYHNLRWLLKVITTTRGSFLCVLKQQKLKQLVWCTHLHALHAGVHEYTEHGILMAYYFTHFYFNFCAEWLLENYYWVLFDTLGVIAQTHTIKWWVPCFRLNLQIIS